MPMNLEKRQRINAQFDWKTAFCYAQSRVQFQYKIYLKITINANFQWSAAMFQPFSILFEERVVLYYIPHLCCKLQGKLHLNFSGLTHSHWSCWRRYFVIGNIKSLLPGYRLVVATLLEIFTSSFLNLRFKFIPTVYKRYSKHHWVK